MIRYWLPVRLLAYDVPHRIRSIDVISIFRDRFDLSGKEYFKKPRSRHSTRDVLLIVGGLLALVAIAAEVRGALGAR